MPRTAIKEQSKDTPSGEPVSGKPFSRLFSLRNDWEALSKIDKLFGLLRGVGVLILIAIPLFLFFYAPRPEFGGAETLPSWLAIDWPGGRVIWTVIIAILPLFIVIIGFYAWRLICPLAFFGRMAEWIEWPDSRSASNSKLKRIRVSPWVALNYPYITWGFLTAMLVLRILILNSNSLSLAITFVALCLLASAVSFRYTGKTWCNYFCPVGTIEKIYTDGDRPNYRKNSQCPKCTGCKTVPTGGLCPDINQENDYWQEIKSPARTWVYYSWPGTVFGFYLWYFLHKPYYWHDLNRQGVFAMRGRSISVPADGGTDWGYYLSGDWTRNPTPWTEWFEQGFGFHGMPAFFRSIPVIAAAPLTILALSAISYLIFKSAEYLFKARKLRAGLSPAEALEAVRHPLFMIAAFVAFLCFYQFAGAPTFRLLPFNLYGVFQFGVVVFATMNLTTRLRRTRTRQLQNDQARKWLKSWPLKERQPPTDLEEAHRVVAEHLRSSEDRARVFQTTIVNLISDGVLTSSELSLLERLQKDLDLSEIDKKLLLKQLSQQFPGQFAHGLFESLRLMAYRYELVASMAESRGALPSKERLEEMQARYSIKAAAHEEILNEHRNPDGTRTNAVREQAERLNQLNADIQILGQDQRPAVRFLTRQLERRKSEEVDHLLEVTGLFGATGELVAYAPGLKAGDSRTKVEAVSWIAKNVPEEIAGVVIEAVCQPTATVGERNALALAKSLLKWANDEDRYCKAGAIHAIKPDSNFDSATKREIELCLKSALVADDPLVRQAGIGASASEMSVSEWRRALSDSDSEVRYSALLEIPFIMASDLKKELESLAEADEPKVSERAKFLLTAGGKSSPEPAYTHLKKMFALNSIKLLSNLPAMTIHSLAKRAAEDSFQPGETLCKEGEPGDSVFLLLEGETEAIQTRNGVEHRLGINHTGESVGEMAILDPGPRMATVRPHLTSVRALVLQGEDFRDLLQRDNSVSMGVIKMLIQRQRKR